MESRNPLRVPAFVRNEKRPALQTRSVHMFVDKLILL